MEPVIIAVTALMIPIVGLVVGAYRNVRQREFAHRERMLALERGLPVPLDTPGEPSDMIPRRRTSVVHGVVWTGIGAGILAGSFVARAFLDIDDDLHTLSGFLMLWAFPALFVGVGLLLVAYFQRNGKRTPPV